MNVELPFDCEWLNRRYKQVLNNGDRAALRRVAKFDEVELLPALYRWFAGIEPGEPHHRIAFLFPYARHAPKARSLAKQLAAANASEARILQVARSESPTDLEYLRRLLRQLDTALDWYQLGGMLWNWETAKRQLVKDYYLAKYTPAKGDK